MEPIQRSDTLVSFCKLKGVDENLFNMISSDNYISYLTKKANDESFFLYSDTWIIPVILKRKYIFRYAEFLSEPQMYSDLKEAQGDFLDRVCKYLKSNNVQWINQPSASTLFSAYPNGSVYIPFGSYIIDLENTTDSLFAKVHSKHRNVIKKAEKDGVDIVIGREELLDDYCVIDNETWARSNKSAYSRDSYVSLLKSCPSNSCVAISYYNNVPQSGAIVVYNSRMGYYLYGASKNKPHTGANNLLQWRLIEYLKQNGVSKYSFVGARINVDEGSKYAGIQKFKERFGGELFSGYLFKVIFNKYHYLLYRVIITILSSVKERKYVKFEDIIDQEIHKWKK